MVQVFIPGPAEKRRSNHRKKGRNRKKPLSSRTVPRRHRLEEGGAQHRGQDQGHHHRQQHGGDDGHGKLAVDDPGGAPEKGHGAEHRGQHQADADQGAGDFSHGLAGGLLGRRPSSLMIRSTFSTTTMASSTSRPMASTMANMVSMLMENPNSPRTAKVPRMTTGTARVGIRVARNVAQEKIHHQEDQENRLEQGLDHLVDGHPHEGRGVIGVDDLHAGREIPGQLLHLRLDGIGGFQGIGAGGLPDGQGGGGLAVIERVGCRSARCPAPSGPRPAPARWSRPG